MCRLTLLRAAVIQLLERKTRGNESYWSISRKCTCRRRKRGREAHLLPWRGPSPFPTVFPLPRKDGDEAFRRQERAFGETQKGLLLLPGLAGCRFPFFAARRGMVFNTLAVERRLSPRQSSLRRRRCWRRDEDIFPGLAFPHSLYGKTFVFAPSVRHTPAHSTL